MKPSKIIHFQLCPDGLYVLDSSGAIWKTSDTKDAKGWKPIPLPTHHQHDVEDEAIAERERRYDVSETYRNGQNNSF